MQQSNLVIAKWTEVGNLLTFKSFSGFFTFSMNTVSIKTKYYQSYKTSKSVWVPLSQLSTTSVVSPVK